MYNIPFKIKIVLLTSKDFQTVNSLEKAFNSWKFIQVFPSTKVLIFKTEVLDLLRSSQQFPQIPLLLPLSRLWHSNLDLNSQFEDLKTQFTDLRNLFIDAQNLDGFGQKPLKEFRLQDDSLIILETKFQSDQAWFFRIKEKKMTTKRTYQSFANPSELELESPENSNVWNNSYSSPYF